MDKQNQLVKIVTWQTIRKLSGLGEVQGRQL